MRDLRNIRCITSEDDKVLVEESEIGRDSGVFSKLFNGKMSDYSQSMESADRRINRY